MAKKKKNRLNWIKFKSDYFDYNMLAAVILLTCFGLVMLYSSTAYIAEIDHQDDMFYFKKQAVISAIGIIAAIGISFFDYHLLYKLAPLLYAGSAILMLLVQTSLGVTINGARRWLNLGVQFQPSETAKIAVVVCVSAFIVMLGRKFKSWIAVAYAIALSGVLFFIAWKCTDNLSTAVIILGIGCIIIFVAHPKTMPFLALVGIAAVIIAILVVYWHKTLDSSGAFRIQRVLVWLAPEKYSDYGGYQILQGLYALGSGGFFGKGLGNSAQKLGTLPETENDMIFPIICEELGVFGGTIVILLFGYLIYRLFFIARNAPDLFGSLLATGIMAHIALQVILNICVVINLIPTTGITLPFFSYGGTSVAFLMAEMAIALSVARSIRFQQEERDLWGDVLNK